MRPQPSRPALSPRSPAGFTLVELMVTVAIVAILASVAAISFSAQGKKAKVGHLEQFMGNVATAQATAGTPYIGLAASGDWCPATADMGAGATEWDTTCEANTWNTLGIVPPNQTYFQYAVIAGEASDSCTDFKSITATCDSFDADPPGLDWWVALGRGDLDGDGTFSTFITSSVMNGSIHRIDELE